MEYSIKPKSLGERRIIHYPQKRIIGLYVKLMRAKKVIVGVAISAMLISSSIPVMAFSVTNGNKTFDKKWELSTTSDGGGKRRSQRTGGHKLQDTA